MWLVDGVGVVLCGGEVDDQWVMYQKPCLVVYLEVGDEVVGLWVRKHIVSASWLLGASCTACEVASGLPPLVCLSSHVKEAVGAKCLS